MSDYDSEGQVKHTLGKNLSRRRMLQAAGAGALAAAGLSRASRAGAATTGAAARAIPAGLKHTMADLKHVVVMMQENRPFDHYFGTLALPGVRGFGDKQALRFQNGKSVFFQPNASRPEGFLLPFRQDTTKFNAQNVAPNMGYFTAEDIPWQHALATAYTVGDHYHASLETSTDPNRIMMWTGTNDPQGGHGGPRINNNNNGQFLFTWETYPEVLQKAGVSWQIYTNNDISTGFLGDFEDNLLRDFAAYNPINRNAENTVPRQGLLARANVLQAHTQPPPGVTNDPSDLDYVLKDFIADCAAGLIPEISWIALATTCP
jgi:phospholipase C